MSEQISAATLKLHPALFSKERHKNWWTPKNELENALLRAWLEQLGAECLSCGKEMKLYGKPNELPALSYIVSLDDGGDKGLSNIRVSCNECAQKSEKNCGVIVK